jgi:hypothetical protein
MPFATGRRIHAYRPPANAQTSTTAKAGVIRTGRGARQRRGNGSHPERYRHVRALV